VKMICCSRAAMLSLKLPSRALTNCTTTVWSPMRDAWDFQCQYVQESGWLICPYRGLIGLSRLTGEKNRVKRLDGAGG
jgi:hypothetical protein